MGDWHEMPLGDVLTLQRGFDLPARDREDGLVPVVSSAGVTGTHSVAKVDPPGVVIGRYGSLGSVHWVTVPYWPHNTALWVKDFKGNDPRFVSYLLRSVSVDGSTASAVPGVNRNHLHRVPVHLPSVDTQVRVATVLAAFDELIEINERRIELLEGLGKSLYREWFEQFRFPRASANPNDMRLPEGWSIRQLGDIAEIVVDGVDPSEVEPDAAYVGLEHLPRRSTTLRKWSSVDTVKSRKLRFRKRDTVFGKLRPYFHKVVWAPVDGVASSDTIILRASGEIRLPGLLNAILSSDALVAEAVAASNGTDRPRANPDVLLRYPVALPDLDGELITHFEQSTSEFLGMAAALAAQVRALSETRDLLLPPLVTGQIDITDLDLDGLLSLGDA